MYSERTLLRKIAHQLIYVIVVAGLVALSLKMFSQEDLNQTNYLNSSMLTDIQELVSTKVNNDTGFSEVEVKKIRNDNETMVMK
jgi:hypothetical protein